ncbi:type IV pilus assembly protein FimV [Onishia niordana]|uniref:type IV pilus assembly protein FimV n=1 Tax=Onishia niordana TaxID=2508711 RepID=UPI00109FB6BA|nr:FimV/HubP family polar landmark protein [Halomonas niordiana]
MKRKFSLVILMSLSALSLPAWSLGVGEAQVESALGAPLEATIPLTDTQGLEPRGLTVSLADAESYRRAGLERSLLLDAVSLSVVPESGRLSIRLSSEPAVNAPYLDLLLEIDGPDGRQQRQVTLLFDPPGFGSQPADSPQQASARQAEPSQASMASRERATGYVDSGETLWSVAKRLRPDADISISQMMLALLDANPNAFPGGNINRLRAGYVLEVPTQEKITSRSADEAWQRVQAHNRAFDRGEPVSGVGASTGRTSGSDAVQAPEQMADIVSGGPDATQPEASGSSVSLDGAQRSALTSEGGQPSSSASSTSDARPADQPDAQSDTQSDTPRLTLLTDAEVESEANAGAVDSLSSEQAERLNRLEAQLSQSQQSLAEIRAERDSAEAELAAMREEVADMRDTLETLAKAQSSSVAQTQGESASNSAVERYLMPLWTAIAQAGRALSAQLAAAGLALLLALWWWLRRRRAADEDNTTDNAPAVTGAQRDAESTEKPRGKSARFAPDVRDAFMPKAEAVSEADIFIAYGRYDKARAILEERLDAEPDRHDLRLKLVKVLVEQGLWQEAHMEAARLALDDDPGRQAELERLLARARGVSSPAEPETEAHSGAQGGGVGESEPQPSSQASPSDEADTVPEMALEPVESTLMFRPPLEREPVAFDGKHHHAEPSWQKGKEVDPEQIREALRELSTSQQNVSGDDDVSGVASHSAGQPPRVEQNASIEGNEQEAASKPVGAAERESESSKSTRDHVIDYHPPTLELETAPPEEAPMQPSVEFPQPQVSAPADGEASVDTQAPTSGEQDIPALGEDAGSNLADLMREPDERAPGSAYGVNEEEWDIEEVAFEPLHLDNDQPVDSPALTRSLVGEAEEHLEQGNHAKAQDKLARALDEGDSETREQAKRLIAQHNL